MTANSKSVDVLLTLFDYRGAIYVVRKIIQRAIWQLLSNSGYNCAMDSLFIKSNSLGSGFGKSFMFYIFPSLPRLLELFDETQGLYNVQSA